MTVTPNPNPATSSAIKQDPTPTIEDLPVLVHGGGIDSSTIMLLLARSGSRFRVIHFHYGQPPVLMECAVISKQCSLFGISKECIDLPKPKKGLEFYKGRNAMILSAAFTMADEVYIGITKDCIFPDSTPRFIEAYQWMLTVHNPKAILHTPIYDLHKGQELLIIRFLGGQDFPYWTCNLGQDRPCGACGHCLVEKSWIDGTPDNPSCIDIALDAIKWFPSDQDSINEARAKEGL